jgi:hypothetical protein
MLVLTSSETQPQLILPAVVPPEMMAAHAGGPLLEATASKPICEEGGESESPENLQ